MDAPEDEEPEAEAEEAMDVDSLPAVGLVLSKPEKAEDINSTKYHTAYMRFLSKFQGRKLQAARPSWRRPSKTGPSGASFSSTGSRTRSAWTPATCCTSGGKSSPARII